MNGMVIGIILTADERRWDDDGYAECLSCVFAVAARFF